MMLIGAILQLFVATAPQNLSSNVSALAGFKRDVPVIERFKTVLPLCSLK
jgi:hypothetical protein